MFESESQSQEVLQTETETKVRVSLKEVGLDQLSPEAAQRLVLLESGSKFNQDSRMIERALTKVLEYLSNHENQIKFKVNDEVRTHARQAAILHDIGKSGSAGASLEAQKMIIHLFSLDDLDPKMNVSQVVEANFEDPQLVLAELKANGVKADLTMRQFWDLHGMWTYEILERLGGDLPERVKIVAASHHIDRGINPYNVSEEEIPQEARMIGAMEDYLDILSERALIAIDKYEARIERGKVTHSEAMDWLRNHLRVKFKNDSVMQMVLEALDEIGKNGKIFE